jgi:two-component system response regulator AtoC
MSQSKKQDHNFISGKILVVDDEQDLNSTLCKFLELAGHSVEGASSAEEALDVLNSNSFDIVVMDVKMSGMSGIEAIPFIKEIDAQVTIIMMTGYDSTDVAAEALRRGAYDHFAKPFELKDIETTIRRALTKRKVLCRDASNDIIGESTLIKDVKELIEMVAPLDSTVLITGESGTGKELVADRIQSQSKRAESPFVKINCAAIPENLLESELFGFEKGAFTGATIQRAGKFELAHNGTILLDEIGEMPLSIQAKLLRIVEQKQVDKLGGSRPVSVDTRIIASTNQDLIDQISQKNFRQDLYYRLNVVSVHLPPLRQRIEDIPLLAQHFLGKIGLKMGISLEKITNGALDILLSYDWPGNVRELANMLERAVIFRKGSAIDASEIRMAFHNFASRPPSSVKAPVDQISLKKKGISLTEAIKQVEKDLILRALHNSNGVQAEAAKLLGLNPKNLWKKIQKYSINPKTLVAESQ